MTWLGRIGIAVLALLFWMRVAPSSSSKWHDPPIKKTVPSRKGYITSIKVSGSAAATLDLLNTIALATPRTKVLAGRVEEGKITYLSRSLIMGAPDYTTVMVKMTAGGSQITLFGRLRFGLYDYGVNRKRIQSWVQTLEALE